MLIRAHSPTFPLLHLRHSSFSNISVALPTSQLILQHFRPFFNMFWKKSIILHIKSGALIEGPFYIFDWYIQMRRDLLEFHVFPMWALSISKRRWFLDLMCLIGRILFTDLIVFIIRFNVTDSSVPSFSTLHSAWWLRGWNGGEY